MTRTNCFWYHEYRDMNMSIPFCEAIKIDNPYCENECKYYISKDDADNVIRKAFERNDELNCECHQNDTQIGTSDLISRADAVRAVGNNVYAFTLTQMDIKHHCIEQINDLPSVSAEPKSKVDTTENPKCDFTSAERVGCDSCIYKTMWKEQEKGNVLPEYAEWIEAYNKMVDVNSDEWVEKTDKEFTKMWNKNILYRLQERFEEEERKAFAKPHGLKEHAVWNKAIKILQEYMQE